MQKSVRSGPASDVRYRRLGQDSNPTSPSRSPIRGRPGGERQSSRRSSVSSMSSVTSRGSADYRRLQNRGIPRAANWGWGFLPFSAKVMLVGVFSGLVAATTPHWAYIKTDAIGHATFGLWHFCSGDKCTSIHDNLVPGRSVPMWYHLTQGMLCIGVACSIVGLAMITNCIEGKLVRMTVTVHRSASCILAISTLEHCLAMYVFISYLEDTDFLYERPSPDDDSQSVDFYGSFYMAVVSTLSSALATVTLFFDDSIYHKDAKAPTKKSRLAGSKQFYLHPADMDYPVYPPEYYNGGFTEGYPPYYADDIGQGFFEEGNIPPGYVHQDGYEDGFPPGYDSMVDFWDGYNAGGEYPLEYGYGAQEDGYYGQMEGKLNDGEHLEGGEITNKVNAAYYSREGFILPPIQEQPM